MKTNISNILNMILLAAVLPVAGTLTAQTTSSVTYSNIALNRTATASSLESSGLSANKAFDGDDNSRFSSGFDDNA